MHGVLPEEQTRPQPFEVDVELTVDLTAAGESDDARRHRRLRARSREAVSRVVDARSATRCSSGSRRASPRCARVDDACHRCRGHRAQAAPAGAGDGRPRRRLASSVTSPDGDASAPTSGIGSNLGDRLGYLQPAVDGLAATDGVDGRRGVAGVRDRAGRRPEQPDYLNAVVAVDTDARRPCAARVGAAPRGRRRTGSAASAGGRARSTSTCCSSATRAVDEPDLVVPAPADGTSGRSCSPPSPTSASRRGRRGPGRRGGAARPT